MRDEVGRKSERCGTVLRRPDVTNNLRWDGGVGGSGCATATAAATVTIMSLSLPAQVGGYEGIAPNPVGPRSSRTVSP